MVKKKIVWHKSAKICLLYIPDSGNMTITHAGTQYSFPENADGIYCWNSDKPLNYGVAIRKSDDMHDTVLHECYHLFFRYLSDIDKEKFGADELSRDLYCMEFMEMYEKVAGFFNKIEKQLKIEKSIDN